MATSVLKDAQVSVCERFVVTENVVLQSELWVSKLVYRQRFVVLHLEVSMYGFGKLNQRQRSAWKHVRFSNSNGVILLVFFETT